MKIPLLIEGAKNFEKWLKRLLPFSSHLKINHLQKKRFLEKELIKIPMLKNFLKCDFYVANGSQLNYIETDLLKNKILLTESLSPLKKSKYLNLGVKEIIDFCPKTNLSIENNEETTYLGSTIIEACMLSLKDDRAPISFKEMNHYIDSQELHSDLTVSKNHLNEKKHFGFLIHPLSSEDFFRVALVKKLKKIPHLSKILEKVLPQIPIFEHARVYNIKSDFDNSEVEGIIYVTLETPKTLLKVDSEKFYRKVLYAIEDAKTKGAKIFGLGAYTKIVGDSGVTLSKRSPLPITTGNSLSAASTLWAAHYGIKKMGFVKIEQGICRGKAMIVGATGSIGKVTAKLLAEQWEEIILVAPRMFKLMEIKEQIEQMFPNTKVQCTTDPHDYLSECDLLITSTSNQEGKLMDIEKVKPGAVICDVSRPFDFTLEDMVKRPDILIISCGEIELPGTNVKVTKDIGLQGQVVYACLAETALLAMEGMLESFSLSRDISFEKIKIIDKLARKHGLKLAAIRSINAEITPEELETCRKHALSRRKKMTITSNVAAKKVQTPAPRSRIKVSKN